MSKYNHVPISDFCIEIVDCLNRTAPVVEKTTPFKMIRTSNVNNGFVDLSECRHVTKETYEKWTRRRKPTIGDIVLTREAPLGNVGIIREENTFLGQRTVQYVIDEEIADKFFLMYYLMSYQGQAQIKALGSGSTVHHMRVPDSKKIMIPNVPLKIQKKVGFILSQYDELIINNNKKIEILEEIAQRLYEKWFVHFKFPGHEKVKIIDSELGKVPEGWHFVKASEVIDFDPKTSVDRNLENKYLPMGSISESSMIISNIEMRKGNSGSKFQNKDTLLARISPSLENGKTGFVNFLKKNETAFGSTEFIVMRSKSVCPEYVYCLARSSKFRATAIKSMRGATGRQRVQRDALESFKVVLPNDNKLINEFHTILEPMFDQIYLLNTKSEVLVKTRDLLLPRLISGEIEV